MSRDGERTSIHGRRHIHTPETVLEKVADVITWFAGSWYFLGLSVVWFASWIIFRIEPFPFGLLTMIVSLEAIVLATLVLMSQNRQDKKNQKRDNLEAQEVADMLNIQQELLMLQRTQMKILRQQDEILASLHKKTV